MIRCVLEYWCKSMRMMFSNVVSDGFDAAEYGCKRSSCVTHFRKSVDVWGGVTGV